MQQHCPILLPFLSTPSVPSTSTFVLLLTKTHLNVTHGVSFPAHNFAPILYVTCLTTRCTKMSTVIHITLYVKNDKSTCTKNQYCEGYNVDDNDGDLLFSPIIFPECIADWAHHRGNIIDVPTSLIRTRLTELQRTHTVPTCVVSKIESIIKYIERHSAIYVGIITVYNE